MMHLIMKTSIDLHALFLVESEHLPLSIYQRCPREKETLEQLMLGQRRRRCTSIKTSLLQCLAIAVVEHE